MFALVASHNTFQVPQHLHLLDEKLYALATGKIKRLMVLMPPRHGKSELCSKYFPAWYIARYRRRVILASYEARFAAQWGRKSRDVLEEWGASIFGVSVSDKSSAGEWWELADGDDAQHTSGGAMMTAGVGGPITGKGCDILIIDDPVKNAEQAASQTYRETCWAWYTSTAYTRLEPNGGVLLIQTRWHDDDLAGRLLKAQETGEGDTWDVVCLPAIAEEDEHLDLAGGLTYERAEGAPLWPERFTRERLAEIRTAVGGKVWIALYQQQPSPDDGVIWKREWLAQRYRERPALLVIVQTVDGAWKTGVANDYSVIATWGATATDFYLLRLWRARVELPDLLNAIRDEAAAEKPAAILIEDEASGIAAIQTLRRDSALPVVAWPAKGSKVSRAAGVTPLGEAGHIHLPEGAPWLADWLDEHVRFPNAAHDDMVDTSSMALDWLPARLYAGAQWGLLDW